MFNQYHYMYEHASVKKIINIAKYFYVFVIFYTFEKKR